MRIRHTVIDSTPDELTLVAAGDALTGVYFRSHWPRPARDTRGERVDAAADPVLAEAHRQLTEYLAGARSGFDLALDPHGDTVTRGVWNLLTDIPFGRTTTYGELAGQVGLTARDVGQIVGRNPLSIVIPCHRVVGSDGRLTGYAGGLPRKRRLLDLEQVESRLF